MNYKKRHSLLLSRQGKNLLQKNPTPRLEDKQLRPKPYIANIQAKTKSQDEKNATKIQIAKPLCVQLCNLFWKPTLNSLHHPVLYIPNDYIQSFNAVIC